MKISEMTDKELIREYNSFNPECLSTRDLLRHEEIGCEIEDRDIEIVEHVSWTFLKAGVEIEEFDNEGKAIVTY